MFRNELIFLFLVLPSAWAQSTCSKVSFLGAKTVDLKASTTSHIDIVRQSDGSYTGFEVTDASPYRVLATTPHFETQLEPCGTETLSTSAPATASSGSGPQKVVSAVLDTGNLFAASISSDTTKITFAVFDAQHNLISERTFTSTYAPEDYPSDPPSEYYKSLTLADLNQDGKLDLIAVANSARLEGYIHGAVWVFLGSGDGTFDAGQRQGLTAVAMYSPGDLVTAGDLNGDGKPDIVLTVSATYSPEWKVFLGNGDGTFQTTAQSISGVSINQSSSPDVSTSIADLNGDGKADVVFSPAKNTSGNWSAWVALGNGDGTFQTATAYSVLAPVTSTTTARQAVAVGDVNDDGILDIVTNTGTILLGDGIGSFPSRKDYAVSVFGSVSLTDFNGDGKSDIVIGNGGPEFLSGSRSDATLTTDHSSLSVIYGLGGGEFAAALVNPTNDDAGVSYAALASSDFNGDGHQDLAWIHTSTNQFGVLLGDGNGKFTADFTVGLGTTSPWLRAGPGTMTATDFDGDGHADLAVLVVNSGGESGEVRVYLGKGDDTFRDPSSVAIESGTPKAFSTPDLNGDGIPDLVVNLAAAVKIWLGKGDATFTGPVFEREAVLPATDFGDFNGDGKLDVVVANNAATSVELWLGKGDGTFDTAKSYPLPRAAKGSAGGIEAADFDADGNPDLAVYLPDKTVAILAGDGDGGFSEAIADTWTTSDWATADVNVDGIPDMLINATDTGYLSVKLGNGDGTFQEAIAIGLVPNFLPMDFDSDGQIDIVGALGNYVGVAGFRNSSAPAAALTVVSGASFASGPLAPGSVASAFGQNMLAGADATSAPSATLPTSLAGLTVHVVDSASVSRLAALYYVSDRQINFVVPSGTSTGSATVTVDTPDGRQLSAEMEIDAVAPSFFTVGNGIAAAYVVRVTPAAAAIEPVFTADSDGITTVPIDLSQPGDVYLALFGTGFDAASATSASAYVQGVSVPVTYAGSQLEYPGLDQTNVRLPASLAGTGTAKVWITIDGLSANTVTVAIE